MENNKISSLEIGALSTFLYKAFILVGGINLLLSINKNDIIISSIIGFIIGFIIIFLFLKTNNILPKYNIFEKLDFLLPKFFSNLIKLILTLCVLIFASYGLYNITLFIQSVILNNVDILPISILLAITIAYLSNKGIKTLVRASLICLFIFIIFESISVLFAISNINSIKILPLFQSDFSSTIYSSFNYITLSFIPLFMLLIIPKNNIKENKKHNKIIKLFFVATNLYTIFNFILLLSIIDSNLAVSINYPEIFILSKISLLNFFDRIEDLLSFKLIFDSFFLISTAITYIKVGIKSIIKKEKPNKYLVFFSSVIIIILSNFINLEPLLIPSLILFFFTNIFILIFYKFS